jgi:hypothetical protein
MNAHRWRGRPNRAAAKAAHLHERPARQRPGPGALGFTFGVASMPSDRELVCCLSRRAADQRFVLHSVGHDFAAGLPVQGEA